MLEKCKRYDGIYYPEAPKLSHVWQYIIWYFYFSSSHYYQVIMTEGYYVSCILRHLAKVYQESSQYNINMSRNP